MAEAEDIALGKYVYCAAHVRPHTSGWCTVPAREKLGLLADTEDEAYAEVKWLRLPIYNLCDVCYKFVANEDWYRRPVQGPRRLACPEHSEEEVRASLDRKRDLDRYIWERYGQKFLDRAD